MPEWLKTVITLALGAGGVQWMRVWMESRRLGRKDFRDTLLSRISELESVVGSLQARMGNLRVEMAHLEVENANLKKALAERDDDAPRE